MDRRIQGGSTSRTTSALTYDVSPWLSVPGLGALPRLRDRLPTRVGAQLLEDRVHVVLDRRYFDAELSRDLRVRKPLVDETDDVVLARRQLGRRRGDSGAVQPG